VDSNHAERERDIRSFVRADCSGRNGFGDINPEVGVTGTPVVDPSTNILYVVEQVRQRVDTVSSACMLWTSRAERKAQMANRPVVISAYGCGTGDGSSGGTIGVRRAERTTIVPGHLRGKCQVYNGLGLASEIHNPYHGWVIAYNAGRRIYFPRRSPKCI